MVLALVFKCDPRVKTKERWEKGNISVCHRWSNRGRRNQGYLRQGNRGGGTIVKEDGVGRPVLCSDNPETLLGKGISMTVPKMSILLPGLICSTRVPGRYFSSNCRFLSWRRLMNRPPSYLMEEYTKLENGIGPDGSCPAHNTVCCTGYNPKEHLRLGKGQGQCHLSCVPGVWSTERCRLFHGRSKPKRKVEPRSARHVQCHRQGRMGMPIDQNICQECHSSSLPHV